jgi:hypothetical protein
MPIASSSLGAVKYSMNLKFYPKIAFYLLFTGSKSESVI